MEILLKHGADKNIVNNIGETSAQKNDKLFDEINITEKPPK